MEILNEWSADVDGRVDGMQRQLVENPEGTITLVAEIDGEVVGFGEIVAAKNELRAVYVSPQAGGRGDGAALLRALEERACGQSVSYLCMDSSLTAASFYEARGYQKLEEAYHVLNSGKNMKCIKMRKDLATNVGTG